jgi:hypothetical protein
MTMKTSFCVLTAVAILGIGALTGAANAAGRQLDQGAQNMSRMRAMSDDKCDAKCDEDSDKCMSQAGKDSAKQRQCDAAYDDCLRKCQGG